MTTLYFEKISQFDREKEPVSVSIPFAKGTLPASKSLVIRDSDQPLPVQTRQLAQWDDGSTKWLIAHFQPNLPGNKDKTLQFDISDTASDVSPQHQVTVRDSEAGYEIDTGVLRFRVPRDGFLPICDIVLHDKKLWDDMPFQGFDLTLDEQPFSTREGTVELELEETGPLRAVILIKGKHQNADGVETFDLNGRITAYAGKPYIEVEHQFIHTEEQSKLMLNALNLTFTPDTNSSPQLALGQGYYRTDIQQSDTSLEMSLTTETLLYQANEHFIDSFYGDFWVDWRDDSGGLTCSMHQAHQNFPKKLSVNRDGITCSLYPEDENPALVLQGMGKTHRLLLHFHPADTPLEDLSTRSLQFQLPDYPSASRDWYAKNNPWIEQFFPDKLPGRLINYFNRLHDGRPKAMGMFHFGDAPDSNYTDQGRGMGETVWVNNEYDRPHACMLYYGLTQQRRVVDSALVNARHWIDVDFCHYNANPLINGGLRIHDRYHATGKVIPSHQWVEGFLDYYVLTGRREGLDTAISVGENILRQLQEPVMNEPGATSTRETGWALRAMVGLWLGTGEERWKQEAQRIVEMFLDWSENYDGLLAPYTSHSMPRVVFMISLTVNSLARFLLIEPDERIEQLIVRTVDDLLAHCIGPDGIFYYKELPSLRREAPTAHALEALTHAWRITDDERYLKVAARQFLALVERPVDADGGKKYVDSSGAVIKGVGGGRIFADKYISILLFAGAATSLGLLDWYEYPFYDVT